MVFVMHVAHNQLEANVTERPAIPTRSVSEDECRSKSSLTLRVGVIESPQFPAEENLSLSRLSANTVESVRNIGVFRTASKDYPTGHFRSAACSG